MTDKQFEVVMNLIADKFAACRDMEAVRNVIKQIRSMVRPEPDKKLLYINEVCENYEQDTAYGPNFWSQKHLEQEYE